MKKNLFSLIIVLSMLVSMFGVGVKAETNLELVNSNVMTNAINLEFSENVSNVTAAVNGTEVTAVVKTFSDSSKTWTIILSEKMDITKKYILSFTATPEDSSIGELKAKKSISFEVLRNDDFTGNQFENVDAVKKEYTMMTNNNNVSGVADETWAQCDLTKDGLKIVNSNATLTPNDFRYLNVYGNCYTVEADMGSFDAGAKAKLWFDNYNFYGADSQFNFDMCVQNNNVQFKNEKFKKLFGEDIYAFDSEYDPITVAISTSANSDSVTDSKNVDFNFAAQGKTYINKPITMSFNARYIGFNATNGAYRLRALRAYKSSMTDIEDLKIDSYEITSKFIRINYSSDVNGGRASVVSCGEAIPVTEEISGNVITITPTDGAFPFDREILFKLDGVSDTFGQTVNAERNFRLKKFLSEDFEGYTSAEQMTKYSIARTGRTSQEVSDNVKISNIPMNEAAVNNEYKNYFTLDKEENGNQRLKISGATDKIFTCYVGYPAREDWKNLILEADISKDAASAGVVYQLDILHNMNTYNEFTGVFWADGAANRMVLEGNNLKAVNYGTNTSTVSANGVLSGSSVSVIVGPQSDKMVTYINGMPVLSADNKEVSGSEFGFRSRTADSVEYVDNIKIYKVEELSGGAVTIMTAEKNLKDGGAAGDIYIVNYDENTAASKLVAAVYDEDNRLIAANVYNVNALDAKQGEKVSYSISADLEKTASIKNIRAFWISGFDTMQPLAGNDVKEF